MSEDLLAFGIKQAIKLGATYAEARHEKNAGEAVTFKNGNLDAVGITESNGIGIRLLINGALGFASTNQVQKAAVKETVETAIKMARAAARTRKKPIQFSQEKAIKKHWEVKPKIKFGNVSVEQKINYIADADREVLSEEKEVKFPSRILVLSDGVTEKLFMNSEGSRVSSKVPRSSLFYMITGFHPSKGAVHKTGQKGEAKGYEAAKDWNLTHEMKNEAAKLRSILLDAQEAPRGELDLVLGSQVVGIVCHEACGHPGEADRILGREAAQAGESYLKPSMLGTQIGTENVTIIDDPTIPNSFGFYSYDDEGVEAKPRYLIKDGRINELLHNRETAAELGVASNASSRAVAYNREPVIRMANTYFQPRDHSFEELLEGVDRGIYLKTFMEWNIDDRRYNQRYVGLEAYIIEKGELKNLVRNPVLEITTPGLYQSVDAIGKDLTFEAATCGKGDPMQGAPVWHGGPDIRLRKVRLGGLS